MNNIEKFNLLVCKCKYPDIKNNTYILKLDDMVAGEELEQFIVKKISSDSSLNDWKETDSICIDSLGLEISRTLKTKRHIWIQTLTQLLLENGIDSFAVSGFCLGGWFSGSPLNHLLCLASEYGWDNVTIKTKRIKSTVNSLLIFKRS